MTIPSTYLGLLRPRNFSAPPGDSKRADLPELVGLRGVAIAIVVFGHLMERINRFMISSEINSSQHFFFELLATPFSGCCLFFCISGYLLMHQICNDSLRLSIAGLAAYVKARALRIIPPYFILLLLNFTFLEVSKYEPVGTNQFHVVPHSLLASLAASLILSHDFIFGTFPRLFPPGWFIET